MPTLRWNPPRPIAQSTAVYEWGVPYAAIVHNGGTLRNGGDIPERPWTEYARENLIDIEADFANGFRRSGNLAQAFQGTAIAYNRAMQQSISQKVWSWPGPTRRRNGETATSPRDIRDTGELRDSQSLRFER